MSELRKAEVPAENPARPRDRRDENPTESRRAWEAFFAAIDGAKDARGSDDHEFNDREAA